MKIQLKHATSNALKEVKLGFSWTTFFFSIFVPLFRGDFLWFIIMLVIDVLTLGLAWIIFAFIYNGRYIKNLLEKGYIPANKVSEDALVAKGLVFRDMSSTQQTNNQQVVNSPSPQPTVSQGEPQQTPATQGNTGEGMKPGNADVESIISQVLSEHQGRGKNVYAKVRQNIPPKVMAEINKQFPEIAEKGEEVLLAIKAAGMFVITKNNYYIRTQGMVKKSNSAFVISETNLFADVGFGTHNIIKFWVIENSKESTIGDIDDMAQPFNKYKDGDIQPVMEIVYKISTAYFGNEAKRPESLNSFRG